MDDACLRARPVATHRRLRRSRRRAREDVAMTRISRSASLCFVVCAAAALAAQQTPPAATSPAGSGGLNRTAAAPSGPAPRLPNGQIDLSGVWQGGGPVGNIADGLAKGDTLPIKPEWKTIMESRKAKDDPE